MELSQYLRVVRAQWWIVAVAVAACVGAALVLALARAPEYEARTQLFVASGAESRDLSQNYQGGLLAQQRAKSYAELVSSPAVARAVVDRLGLDESPEEVRGRLDASVPVDTVLLDVSARADSAAGAKRIADAVAVELPRVVDRLETAPGEDAAPVRLSVASPAQLPAEPAGPRTWVYLALGLVLGLAIGLGAALLRHALDDRLRSERQAAAVAGAPVLASVPEHPRRAGGVAEDRSSPGLESYRRLRAGLASTNGAARRLLVTSATAGRGTAAAVANLGLAFAEAGRRVVLVDANLRAPELGELLALRPAEGLSEVVLDGVAVEDALQRWHADPRVEVLGAGAQALPSSDVLSSPRFAGVLDALTARADVVIVSSASLPEATDAAVVAPLTSGAVVLTRLPATRVGDLERAVQDLEAAGGRVLGLVAIR